MAPWTYKQRLPCRASDILFDGHLAADPLNIAYKLVSRYNVGIGGDILWPSIPRLPVCFLTIRRPHQAKLGRTL
jgi:hypothetical protein